MSNDIPALPAGPAPPRASRPLAPSLRVGSTLVVDSAPLVLKDVGINAKLDQKEYGAAAFGFNMLGDALRDVLAPRLPGT